MKTTLTSTAIALGMAVGLNCAGLAFADEQDYATKHKYYDGTVLKVDPKEHTFTVRGLVTTRTFNAADNCQISLEDKSQAAWSDLRPGQKVELRYHNAHGVYVAHQVAQQNRVFKGYVTCVDPARHMVSVKHGGFTRDYTLAENGNVLIKDDKSGSLADLKLGDTVNVIYESEDTFKASPMTAQRIEQKNPTFTGNIRSLDATTKTVKVRSLMGEKTFHLGDGCKIVANGKVNGSLRDLRIGDSASVSYEDANGVLVANRIGREAESPDANSNQTAAVGDLYP